MKPTLLVIAALSLLVPVLAAPPVAQAQACRVCVPEVEGEGDGDRGLQASGRGGGAEGGDEGGLAELAALEFTLAALGIDYVVTPDPATEVCQVALSYPGCPNCFFVPDLAWVQAGHGLVQISDWGPGHQENDWNDIAEGAPVQVQIVDAGHPITQGLPAGWTSLGFWRYGFSEEDYYGWVTDPDANLAQVEGVDRALSARTEGAGRLVYIGWNVYGPEATAPDATVLRQAIEWAGQCSNYQPPLIQEVPALSQPMLAALAVLLGGFGLVLLARSRRRAA